MYYQISETTTHGLIVKQQIMFKLLVICPIQLSDQKVHVLEQINKKLSIEIIQAPPIILP